MRAEPKILRSGPELEVIRLYINKMLQGISAKKWVFLQKEEKNWWERFSQIIFPSLFLFLAGFHGFFTSDQPYRKKLRNGAIKTFPRG